MNHIEDRLRSLNITLPVPADTVANYVSFVHVGSLVFISGQTSIAPDGKIITGRLGEGLSLEQGKLAAKYCGLRLISQMKAVCEGDLSRVKKIVKLGGFVCTLPEDSGANIPKIINGCSDLLVEVFGDIGKHARFAVGTPALPRDCAVEIDAVVEIKP